MAAAAETLQTVGTPYEVGFLQSEIRLAVPQIYEVPKLDAETFVRKRAERFIGKVALQTTVEVAGVQNEETRSLMDALHMASNGNAIAQKLVETNVRTDVMERTIKAGHVMKVELSVNEQGQVVQFGQTAESIQANSLRFASEIPQMRQRTEAETRNMFRIDSLNRARLLDEYAFVVFSRAADDMSVEEADEVGFFTDTMSCAIQLTTANGQALMTESAFVAGKRTASSERHDAATIVKLGSMLGVDFAGKSAAEILDTPLLIHKSLLKNGVVDLVRMYDQAAGGTFFGQEKPVQDYVAYRRSCAERELELEPTVQQIVAGLLSEVSAIRTPVEATRKLHELSQASLVARAVTDERIDTSVFGTESAAYIEAARYWHERGDLLQAERFISKAQITADSKSCPGGPGSAVDGPNSTKETKSTEGDDEDCEFISKSCPLCGTKNVKTTVKKIAGGKKHISGSCGCSKVL